MRRQHICCFALCFLVSSSAQGRILLPKKTLKYVQLWPVTTLFYCVVFLGLQCEYRIVACLGFSSKLPQLGSVTAFWHVSGNKEKTPTALLHD